MEEKKAKVIFFGSSSAREEEGMISKLPDSLISHILSYLPTKQAVRTSVLSNRWKSLWLFIPGLDLDSDEFPDYNGFASFIDRCLDFYWEEKSCLHKLKLSIRKDENDNDNQSCVTDWIDFVATSCKLKHLDVECFMNRNRLEVIPVSLFLCETLLDLRLCQVLFGSSSFEDSSSVSLPRLKTMRLEWNIYANERSLESLISSCPVLEDLSVVRRVDDNVKVLRVRSQTLTSLSLKYHLEVDEVDDEEVDYIDPGELGVLIDADRLEYLNFEDEISASKSITNPGSLTKVDFRGEFYLDQSDDQVRKFYTSFSGVKDLNITFGIFRFFKNMVPLPQFCNLSCLEAELSFGFLDTLRILLVNCPNLRSLILVLIESYVRKEMRGLPVPLCLLSSLEFVEIKCKVGEYPIMEVARYFAENSVILKKFVLRLSSSTVEEKSVVLRDLLALPWRSSSCQILVC